jgi:hypothetical protein
MAKKDNKSPNDIYCKKNGSVITERYSWKGRCACNTQIRTNLGKERWAEEGDRDG